MREPRYIAPAPGVVVRELAGRRIVFSEQGRAVYELDPVSYFLLQTTSRFPEGVRFESIVKEAQWHGIPNDAAIAAFEQLKSLSLLISFEENHRICVAIGRRRCLLILPYTLHCQVSTIFRSLVWAHEGQHATDRLVVVERAGRYVVSVNGQPDCVCWPNEIIPFIRAVFTDLLLASKFLIALHVATLCRQGKTILLAGEPGAGKTTLAMALKAASGFDIYGDDVALLHQNGDAEAVAFPASVKSGSWPLLASWYSQLSTDAAHLRTDGQEVKFLPVRAGEAEAQAVAQVFFLHRGSKYAPALVPLDELEVFRRLLAEASGPEQCLDVAGFEGLHCLCSRAQGWEVRYDHMDAAIALIEEATG